MGENSVATIAEHDKAIVENWNNTVTEEDTVYCLGDVAVRNNGQSRLKDIIRKLKGRIILVKGNHDYFDNEVYLDMGFYAVHDRPFYLEKKRIIKHEPEPVGDYCMNIHGHLHGSYLNLPNYKNVSANLINMTPTDLDEIINSIELKEKFRHYGDEWWSNNQVYCEYSRSRTDIVLNEEWILDREKTFKLWEDQGFFDYIINGEVKHDAYQKYKNKKS